MPSTFQSCLLVTALASFSNAQVYLNLEQEPVDNRAFHGHDDEQHEHERHQELDHAHDGEDMRYADHDEEAMLHNRHFKEVHHPHEDFDFGSKEDEHRHYSAADDRHHPREAADSYQHHHEREWNNEVPFNGADENGQFDNVLEDEDPAICFVKAYARKPLGAPKKTVANSMDMDDYWYDAYEGFPSNALDYWYDDYEDEDDYGDEYDNYGLYDDYSDSEGDYYDEEDGEYTDEEDSSGEEEEDETSSEDEFSDEDLWNRDLQYKQHAQYFDLAAANQQAPPTTASKPATGASTDSEESDEDEDSSENEANQYGLYGQPRRHRKRQGKGDQGHRGGQKTRRHPTGQKKQVQQPVEAHQPADQHRQRRRHRRGGREPHPMPVHPQAQHELPAHFPVDAPGAGKQRQHRKVPKQQQQPLEFQQQPQHDRHGPPPSARSHRRRKTGKHAATEPEQFQQQPAQHQGRRQRKRKQQRHTLANEEVEPVEDDYTCPKFFEKNDEGCEKPLSLWRGNGQKKKCKNCQKCEEKWFPQCPPSFVVTECDVCAPVCPDGMIDHEGTCMKPGLEVVTECDHDEQMIDGECYRQCPGQTSEFDILCFGLCPMDMYKCGHTLCLKSDQQCPQYVAEKAINLEKLVEKYKLKDHFGSRLIDLSHQSMFPFPECH